MKRAGFILLILALVCTSVFAHSDENKPHFHDEEHGDTRYLIESCLFIYLLFYRVHGDTKQGDTLYDTPKPSGSFEYLETFNGDHWTSTWKPSTDPKYTGMMPTKI